MYKLAILDTSVASSNIGDSIICESCEKIIDDIFPKNFKMYFPTHTPAFNIFQLNKNVRIEYIRCCDYKILYGTNLIFKSMLSRQPQWNINIINSLPLSGAITLGVGLDYYPESTSFKHKIKVLLKKACFDNFYTKLVYRNVLSRTMLHSVRDENTKRYFIDVLKLNAINTGCPTLWCLTPEFCNNIPTNKADSVIFELNSNYNNFSQSQYLIDCLHDNYKKIYYWSQQPNDIDYIYRFNNTTDIKIISSSLRNYKSVLQNNDIDYVGMRLHGAIFAMQNSKRAILIGVDDRIRNINLSNNLNMLDINNISKLNEVINSEIITNVKLNVNAINKWKNQFNTFN